MNDNLRAIRFSSSVLLAKVVNEMFPDARLISNGADELGFWCDFAFRKPIDDGTIEQLEERFLQLMAKSIETESMTMMRDNALEFLQHQHPKSTPQLPKSPLVEILKIENYSAPCPLPHISNTSEIRALKLFPLSRNKSNATRITGISFSDQKELKNFLKLLEIYKKVGHPTKGEQLGLFTLRQDNLFWKEKGLQWFQNIQDIWRKWTVSHGYCQASSPLIVDGNFRFSHLETQKFLLAKETKIAEWGPVATLENSFRSSPLLNPQTATLATTTTVCSEREAANTLISSLHSIEEIIRMFDINTQWFWCANKADNFRRNPRLKKDPSTKMFVALSQKAASQSKIDFATCEADRTLEHSMFVAKYRDLLGRSWDGPTIYCEPLSKEKGNASDQVVIHCNLLGPIERLVALLIEGKGALPFDHETG